MSERDALTQPEAGGEDGELPAQSLAQRVAFWASVAIGLLLGTAMTFLGGLSLLSWIWPFFGAMHEFMVFQTTYNPDSHYILAAFGLRGRGALVTITLFFFLTMLAAGVGLLVAIIGTLLGRFKGEQLELVNALFICDAVGLTGYFAVASMLDFWVADDDLQGPIEAGSFPMACLSGILLAARLVVTAYSTFSSGRQKLILAFGALCVSIVMVSVIAHYAVGADSETLSKSRQAYIEDCKKQTGGSMCM